LPENRLVLMDLDRTLFDTGLFFDDIWQLAAQMYGCNKDEEKTKAANYHRMYGEWYDYDFFQHLQEATDAVYSESTFIQAAQELLTSRYLFDDVTEDVLQSIDAIVTFGNKPFQQFKLSLCPQLASIETHIILEPKGHYISRTFKRPSLLVDDKDIAADIIPPAEFVQIVRTHAPEIRRNYHRIISSLQELPGVLLGMSAH
jgi:hypothetical protein